MRTRRKIKDFLSALLLLGLMAVASAWLAKQSEVSLQGEYRIVDGDSLFLDGQEIRLLGVDAPEYRQSCELEGGASYACGKQARQHLVNLVRSGTLTCTGWEEDKYQRLLAICKSGEVVINAQMVKDGWALSYGDYESEEADARSMKIGVWQGGFDRPQAWRENAREAHSISWLSKFSLW